MPPPSSFFNPSLIYSLNPGAINRYPINQSVPYEHVFRAIPYEHVFRADDNPLVDPIARRFIRFADGEYRRYSTPVVLRSHGSAIAINPTSGNPTSGTKRIGLAMASVKRANDTEEFYKCLANQSAYAASAARRLATEGPRGRGRSRP